MGLSVAARDHDIFAFRQRQRREGADHFADHVAAGRQHREAGVGERFAPGRIDELESHHGGAVAQRRFGELAGLHSDVGTHLRIGVAIVRDDVVEPFRHHHHRAGHHVFGDRPAVAGLELAAFIDVEGNLAGGYRHIADAAFNAQAASRQFEILAHGRATQGHRLDRGRQPEPDMHNVISRRQHQSRRGGLFFADQLECTAGLGLGGVDAPG